MLAGFWAVLLVYCSRVLKIVIRLALIQHIPVEDHTTLFALAMIASATLKTLIEVLVNQEWVRDLFIPVNIDLSSWRGTSIPVVSI